MTYGEFKEQLGYLLAGDSDIRNDKEAVQSFYRKAADSILTDCEPLKLITSDRERFRQYRALDDVYFVRWPEYPEADGDALDMDGRLQEAILYLVAADMVRMANDMQRRAFYLGEVHRIKDQYRFEVFNYLQDTGYFGNFYQNRSYTPTKKRKDLPPVLDEWGLLKYYLVRKEADGWRYDWDECCADVLDRFMMDGDGSHLSPSQLALWEQMCAWEDAAVSGDPETKALGTLDKIYLERSGLL